MQEDYLKPNHDAQRLGLQGHKLGLPASLAFRLVGLWLVVVSQNV